MAQYMKQLKAEVTRLNARLDTNDDKIEQLQADNQNIRAHLEAVEKAIAMLE
jgi:prefoldin subunit 5